VLVIKRDEIKRPHFPVNRDATQHEQAAEQPSYTLPGKRADLGSIRFTLRL
jgi:hypothetical protein